MKQIQKNAQKKKIIKEKISLQKKEEKKKKQKEWEQKNLNGTKNTKCVKFAFDKLNNKASKLNI